jgi:hypothetical protein
MVNFSKFALAAAFVLSATGVSSTFPANAASRTVPMVGKPSKTTITRPDGSKEVITPDGRHSFYNFDGTPRGINRTCSSGGGLTVSCANWGPNSYGGTR